jgi:eukaryotic-like serine/threonine-protein kinase
MAAKVKLTVEKGRLRGEEFVFDAPARWLVGRGEDCSPRLPNDLECRLISRHHCLLEIDPPAVRVFDLGSRNGTFVNGRLIGRRPKCYEPEGPAPLPGSECVLADGDELDIGPIVFRVSVAPPPPPAAQRPAGEAAPPEEGPAPTASGEKP